MAYNEIIENKYVDYFNIDENYYPVVSEDLINSGTVDWKKYYPNESFKKLLKDTTDVLSRKKKLSIWVNGAYGTGKTHAVLTLKKLIEANSEDTKDYFKRYTLLTTDEYNKLERAKKNKRILTVMTTGTSSIDNDYGLAYTIQENIISELKKKGYDNYGCISQSKKVLNWLKIDANRKMLNEHIKNSYNQMLNVSNVVELEKMLSAKCIDLKMLMNRLDTVFNEIGISIIKFGINELKAWIHEIIEKNNLDTIFFIWDEFTEFFNTNFNRLTGLQNIVELSSSIPFYMCIVTHQLDVNIKSENRPIERIKDRFVNPICDIKLPDETAIKLVIESLKRKSDPKIKKEWESYSSILKKSCSNSLTQVTKYVKIKKEEIEQLIPFHPYALLVLKYISEKFNSNQRSMFDFIKNKSEDEKIGFQWFISNVSPFSNEPFLTIDYLWRYFNEKTKGNIGNDLESILRVYYKPLVKTLNENEQRLLKIILLLQIVNEKSNYDIEIFNTSRENLETAIEGTCLQGNLDNSLNVLIEKNLIIFRDIKVSSSSKNIKEYIALQSVSNIEILETKKTEIRDKLSTDIILSDFDISSKIMKEELGLLKSNELRFDVTIVTVSTFNRTIKNKINHCFDSYKIPLFIAISRRDQEVVQMQSLIKEIYKKNDNEFIIIDTSASTLGVKEEENYIEYRANEEIIINSDKKISEQHKQKAKEIIDDWVERIGKGKFTVYSNLINEGETQSNKENLIHHLSKIVKKKYPFSIEFLPVHKNLFRPTNFSSGTEYGCLQKLTGIINNKFNDKKISDVLSGAWQEEKYWLNSDSTFEHSVIKRIKIFVNSLIDQKLSEDGRVSINEIYEPLSQEPYGFMPCNLTAFILGFILKEFVNDKFNWSNGNVSEVMSIQKLKQMVDGVLKKQLNQSTKYRDEFIVSLTENDKALFTTTSEVFNIPREKCASIEKLREELRLKVSSFVFPFILFKYSIKSNSRNKGDIEILIQSYNGLLNDDNSDYNELEDARRIGRKTKSNPSLINELKVLISRNENRLSMEKYIVKEHPNFLKLIDKISFKKCYINDLVNKFSENSNNTWLWHKSSIDSEIGNLELLYKFVELGQKFGIKIKKTDDIHSSWVKELKKINLPFSLLKEDDNLRDIVFCLENIYDYKYKKDIKLLRKIVDVLYNNFDVTNEILKNPQDLFMSIFNNELKPYDIKTKKTLFTALSINEYESNIKLSKDSYKLLLKNKIVKLNENKNRKIMISLWKNTTGTDSPYDWSKKNKLSIYFVLPFDEVDTAKLAVKCFTNDNVNNDEIKKAISFIKNSDALKKSYSDTDLEEIFKNKILKNYKILFENVNEVKDFLLKKYSNPILWYGDVRIDSIVKKIAEEKYLKKSNKFALAKIDRMDDKKAKDYLKKLIMKNVNVGIEILNDN